MKIDVPLRKQEEGSRDCGIVSLLMIFEYFGVEKTLEEIQSDLLVDEVGTYSPQMGKYLIENGFSVEIITHHPGLFTIHDREKSQQEILKHFEKLFPEEKNEQNKKVLKYFIEFMNSGGKVIVKIPDVDEIKRGIEKKSPLLSLMTTNFLSKKDPKFNFHFNVIKGIDDEFVYANDPGFGEGGGEKKYVRDDFFFALHAASYGDLDNGSLMMISR